MRRGDRERRRGRESDAAWVARDRAAAHPGAGRDAWLAERRRRHEATPTAPPAEDRAARVLGMSARAEEAVIRFLDEGWQLGHRADSLRAPSRLWIGAWCLIGTAHLPMLPVFAPAETPDQLEAPCAWSDILLFASRPALSAEEAEHRATRFCHGALERARALYRDGFYADPFIPEPIRRAA